MLLLLHQIDFEEDYAYFCCYYLKKKLIKMQLKKTKIVLDYCRVYFKRIVGGIELVSFNLIFRIDLEEDDIVACTKII